MYIFLVQIFCMFGTITGVLQCSDVINYLKFNEYEVLLTRSPVLWPPGKSSVLFIYFTYMYVLLPTCAIRMDDTCILL